MKKADMILNEKGARELAPDALEQVSGGIPEPVKRKDKDKTKDKERPEGVPEPVHR